MDLSTLSLKNNILGNIQHKDKVKTKWLKTNSPIEIVINNTTDPLGNFREKENQIMQKLRLIPIKEVTIQTKESNFFNGIINIDWSRVVGYDDIKTVINRTLNNANNKKTHLMIGGPAGTSKTVFLKTIESNLSKLGLNVHYLDATTLSSSGVIEYLFSNEVTYCLLDELDKLEKEHQGTFLNLLESGLLQETKHKRIRKKDQSKLICIATANYLDRIMEPLLTRFLVLEIPEYTKEQFYDISNKILASQYNKTNDIAYYITDRLWSVYTTKKNKKPNMRQCVQVANISPNDKSQIDIIINTIEKYSKI